MPIFVTQEPTLRKEIRAAFKAMNRDEFPEVDEVAANILNYGEDEDERIALVNDRFGVIGCQAPGGFFLVFAKDIETHQYMLVHVGSTILPDKDSIALCARALGIANAIVENYRS